MASNLALSGLASGVDTSGIVSRLMALERQATTRLGFRQAAVDAQRTALRDVAGKLSALQSAAEALAGGGLWAHTQRAESSDPARVAVSLTGGAGIGGHAIQVERLAASMQRGFSFSSATAGRLTIAPSNGAAPEITVDVAAGATIQQVADAINAKTAGPVVAAVVRNAAGEERLVLSARRTGSESDFTVSAAGVLTADAAYTTSDVSRLNAIYTLDGVVQPPSQSNVLEDAVPGVRITLKGVTSAAATVTVSAPELDREAVNAKVKAFAAAYNAVVDATRARLSEKPVASPTSAFQAGLGTLYGDAGLQSMLSGLRRRMTAIVEEVGVNDLADLGVSVPKAAGGTTSDDAKAGRLVVDEAKLSAALEADWTAVKGFFEDFAHQVGAYVRTQTGGSGVIDSRLAGSERTATRIQQQIDATNVRLDAREKRLKAQFAAMELALQSSQTQQAWLASQLAALDRSR